MPAREKIRPGHAKHAAGPGDDPVVTYSRRLAADVGAHRGAPESHLRIVHPEDGAIGPLRRRGRMRRGVLGQEDEARAGFTHILFRPGGAGTDWLAVDPSDESLGYGRPSQGTSRGGSFSLRERFSASKQRFSALECRPHSRRGGHSGPRGRPSTAQGRRSRARGGHSFGE